MGTALMMYAQDYDESHPGVWFGPVNRGPWSQPTDGVTFYKWMDAVYPYVKNEQVFTCPSDGVNKKFVVAGGKLQARELKIGDRVGYRVEVLGGLEADDLIAVTDVDNLADGQSVSISTNKTE